jgi:hypothetical protein
MPCFDTQDLFTAELNQLQQQLFQAKLRLIGEGGPTVSDEVGGDGEDNGQQAGSIHKSASDGFTYDNPFLDDNPFSASDESVKERAGKGPAGIWATKGPSPPSNAGGGLAAPAEASVAVISEDCAYLLPNGRSQESLGVAADVSADIHPIGSLEDVTGCGGGDQDSDGVMIGDVVDGVGEEAMGEVEAMDCERALGGKQSQKSRRRWAKATQGGCEGAVRDAKQPACGCAMM